MDEQKLMDMFIQERINMLLLRREKSKEKNSSNAENRLMQAELFIKSLPDSERELMDFYFDYYLISFFKEEAFLYQNGFGDGVRVTNFLGKL